MPLLKAVILRKPEASTEMLYQSVPLRARCAANTLDGTPQRVHTVSEDPARAHENRSTNATDRLEAFLLDMHRR